MTELFERRADEFEILPAKKLAGLLIDGSTLEVPVIEILRQQGLPGLHPALIVRAGKSYARLPMTGYYAKPSRRGPVAP